MTSAPVNRPTNVKQKEADVNQKLQLYGIYTGKTSVFIPTIGAVRFQGHASGSISANVLVIDCTANAPINSLCKWQVSISKFCTPPSYIPSTF